MLQFGAGLAATSNPFCVNGEELLSRNRARQAPRRIAYAPGSFLGQCVGRADRAARSGLRCLAQVAARSATEIKKAARYFIAPERSIIAWQQRQIRLATQQRAGDFAPTSVYTGELDCPATFLQWETPET